MSDVSTWVGEHRDGLVTLLQRLIQAPSENPPGGEARVASVVLDELHDLGARVEVLEAAPNRVNVVGVLEGSLPGPSLMCNAHLDTVPAGDGWTDALPFAGDLKDSRIYGRGAVDHKSPVAALLYAARAMQAHGRLRGRLVFIFDADEERGGRRGMRHVLDVAPPDVDMALYAAPTSYSSSGADFFGVGVDNVFNASVGRVKVCVRFETAVAYQVAPGEWWYPGEVGTRVAASIVETFPAPAWFGGRPRARLITVDNDKYVWEIFVLPDETPEEVERRVRECVSREVARLARVKADLAVLDVVRPAKSPTDHALVSALCEGARVVSGRDPYVGALCAVTGMSPIQDALGIPVAAFGYGRIDLCHVANEHIAVDALVSTALSYAEAFEHVAH